MNGLTICLNLDGNGLADLTKDIIIMKLSTLQHYFLRQVKSESLNGLVSLVCLELTINKIYLDGTCFENLNNLQYLVLNKKN